MKNIIVFCAHDDDLAVGALGTIMKYRDKGDNVIEVVFSAGEMSHPHLKCDIVTRKRSNETLAVNEKLGIETLFLGLSDSSLNKQVSKELKDKVKEVIETYKPYKIYMHSEFDTHKDHRAVFKCLNDILKYLDIDCGVYSYEVWNIFPENKPCVYVDISDYFVKKVNIMKQYKSQKHFIYPLILPVYIRAKVYGKKINVKYAEKFYKLR